MKYELRFTCGDNGGIGKAKSMEELLRVLEAFLSVPEANKHEMVIKIKRLAL